MITTLAQLVQCSNASSLNIVTSTERKLVSVCLTSVSGAFSIYTAADNTVLFNIDFPALTYVGGAFAVYSAIGSYNLALASLALPVLSHVGGQLVIEYNAELSYLTLPVLTYVGLFFQVENNARLSVLAVPKLATIANTGDLSGLAASLCLNAPGLSFSHTINRAAGSAALCFVPPCAKATKCS